MSQRGSQIAAGAGVIAFGGYIYSLETIPFTHRRHSVLVSASVEQRIGAATFNEIKQHAALKRPDHPSVITVRNISRRLIKALEKGDGGGAQGHLRNLNWEFAVVEAPDVNAFVCPGGKVVVYTGLMDRLKSKDELAAVLSHEIAHIVARHTAEQLTESSFISFLRISFALLFGLHLPFGFTSLLLTLPHSRRNETEADAIGLELMARACYRPEAMISVFEMLDALEKASGMTQPTVARTHPLSSERVRVLQDQMARIRNVSELAGCTEMEDAFATTFR